MDCGELRTLVEQAWEFLFTDFGFAIVSCQEGTRGSAMLCAESREARVRFMSVNYDDEFDIDWGTRSAPLDWSPNSDVTTNEFPEWYSLRGILGFLEREPLDVEEIVRNAKETYANRNIPGPQPPQIEVLAKRTRPLLPKILSFFSMDGIDTFRVEYTKHKIQQKREFERQWNDLSKRRP